MAAAAAKGDAKVLLLDITPITQQQQEVSPGNNVSAAEYACVLCASHRPSTAITLVAMPAYDECDAEEERQ
jgi:hypothetical protein